MKSVWKLQDAKAKFSEVVENAVKNIPQYITRRGQKAVVIMSTEEYEKITSNKLNFKDFLIKCPKTDQNFNFERQKDYSRSTEF